MNQYDEKRVVEGISAGSVSAFRQLVERYKKKVYFLAYNTLGKPHEAEDISQEVFIRVFRHRKRVKNIHKIGTWIHRITVNRCIDELRKKSRHLQVSLQDPVMENIYYRETIEDNPGSDPESEAVIQSQIRDLLGTVTPRERSVVILRYLEGFKIGEIAGILRVSDGAVKSLLVRARRKMQARMNHLRLSEERSER